MPSKTPPPSSPLPLPGTPVHTRSTTTDQFLPRYENRETTFQRLSTEMSSYFVGPMPPQEFLDTFLPVTSSCPSVPRFKLGMFSNLSESSFEANMYQSFVSSEPLTSARLVNPPFPGRYRYSTPQKPQPSQYI
jgi:hypothetical protein